MPDDRRLDEAKAIPIEEVALRLGLTEGLQRLGRELTGPCPNCGGHDRFSINIDRHVWLCRHGCSDQGADGIGLVRLVLGCDFRAALDYLVGAADVRPDPEVEARRRRELDRQARSRLMEAERHRMRAIRRARAIWDDCRPASGTLVEAYLEARGIRMHWLDRCPPALRFHPALPYMALKEQGSGEWIELHRGPAMVAAVTDLDNRVTGVHRTWIDPTRPKGKALICKDGEPQDVKKVWGHKKGCAIRLGGMGERITLVVGEGIETTLTARVAWARPGMHFWAGVDLGNMGGRRQLRGKGMKYAGVPDMDDADAFLPPEGVRELIFIQDGDSDPKLTRAKLLSGLRRAKAAVASVERIRIVPAGDGRDLNDLLMDADHE